MSYDKDKKMEEYTSKIYSQMIKLFDNDCENQINESDFHNDDNSTLFIHCLANIVPSMVYERLTRDSVDLLGFNHIANRLCVQNLNIKK